MEQKVVKTVCPRDCFGGCTMNVHVEDGKMVKVEGAKGNKASYGVLCKKGMHSIDYVYSPNRLKYPMVRTGQRGEGKFERVSWDYAVQAICDKLNNIKENRGPLGVMHFGGGGCKGMLSNYYKSFFSLFGGYTTKRGNLCNSAGIEGINLTYGDTRHNAPWDLENAKLIIVWGKNPANTNIHDMMIIKNAVKNGSKLVTIDPIKSATAKNSDMHISPKPGTDIALALGVISLLIQRGSIDNDFVEKYTEGFTHLKEHVLKYTPSIVADICGINEDEIISIVKLIEEHKPMTLICGVGIQRYKNGGQTVRAISMIPALTGDVGRIGGGFRFLNNKQWSSFSWPYLPENNYHIRSDYAASQLGEAIENQSSPNISMLWIERANPLVMHPDTNRLRAALDKLQHIVVVDQFMTDTARYADIILPAKSFFEYSDLFTGDWTPYISMYQKTIEPYYESKNESEIYRMLGEHMGYDMQYLPEYNDDTLNNILKKSGIDIDVDRLKEEPYMRSGMEIAYADKKFNTPSGKIELYSDSIAHKWGESPLPEFDDMYGTEKCEKYPLRFLSTHIRDRLHSQFADIKGLDAGEPLLYISSKDAAERGIESHDEVIVFNDRGNIRVYAMITDDIKTGVTNVYEGLSNHTGANVNVLTGEFTSDIGCGAAYYECFVDVKKCRKVANDIKM